MRLPPRRTVIGLVLAAGLGLVALGGLFAGQAHEPDRFRASRFSTPEAERAAQSACASTAPFVVVDTFALFKPANIDDVPQAPSDNREQPLLHGDVVAAIAEASHPGTIAYQTDPIFNVRSLAADFRRLARDIESGRIARPAAVVSSIVLPVDLRQINARFDRAEPFEQSGVAARKRELLDLLSEGHDPRNPYSEIDAQLARLRKAGVPVFVAAGNTGPDQIVNALALSEGVYAVGALDRDGGATPYTSAPGLVSVWSPGFVVLTEAPGGLSVSGGRGVELKGADLPEQRAVIARFGGKRAVDVVLETPAELRYLNLRGPSRQRNRYLARTLEHGLYRTDDLMAAYGYSESSGTFARAVADGPYMHFPSDTIFRATVDGTLVFDPIGDRSEGQLQVADATSFAAPNICASQLFASRVTSPIGQGLRPD
ncbi:S8/S53 family peptidase [Hansschlegelia zhihuaiae]|uniref:Peptidase S8/S53 domain-containing protein n=1 Tax=Hansschlegelia zhihuaiae TaxID=405005 RepID=A0A4Q0MJ45_9HYPH|nr:S8/S53 family peptidase [Hansschlegelia zhihuaiae]RXF73717.1 hypothetical protein EK403_09020 [Hansschlegelia zhihuaiae]